MTDYEKIVAREKAFKDKMDSVSKEDLYRIAKFFEGMTFAFGLFSLLLTVVLLVVVKTQCS